MTTKVTPPQQQDVGTQQPVLPRTKVVSVENLAASTTEQQLKSLCQGIGVLEASQNPSNSEIPTFSDSQAREVGTLSVLCYRAQIIVYKSNYCKHVDDLLNFLLYRPSP